MNEDILIERNISKICYETANIDCSKKIHQIIPNVVNFYIKHIIGSNNIYHTVFIKTKLLELVKCYEENNVEIRRKLLVEIYLYMALCNKPVKDKKPKYKKIKLKDDEVESILVNEMKTQRKMNIIYSCIDIMYKNHNDNVWNICYEFSEMRDYVEVLKDIFNICRRKELLYEAFEKISKNGLIYSNQDYRDVIFQCLMKINYIYSEKDVFDKHMEIYLKCLNCPIETLTNTIPVQYNRISYIHDEKRKSLEIKPKQQEYLYFEKITKSE